MSAIINAKSYAYAVGDPYNFESAGVQATFSEGSAINLEFVVDGTLEDFDSKEAMLEQTRVDFVRELREAGIDFPVYFDNERNPR